MPVSHTTIIQTRDGAQIPFTVPLGLYGIDRFSPEELSAMYPPEVFAKKDDDFNHTQSCGGMAYAQVKPAPESGFSLATLLGTLAAHDQIELFTGDNPVLSRNDSSGDKAGYEAARAAMEPEAFKHFMAFEQAKNYIQSFAPGSETTIAPETSLQAEAITAVVIDLVQGNTQYFEIISEHFVTKKDTEGLTPQDLAVAMDSAAAYFYRNAEIIQNALSTLPDSPAYNYAREVSMQFLEQQSEFLPLIRAEIDLNNRNLFDIKVGVHWLISSMITHEVCQLTGPAPDFSELVLGYQAGIASGKVTAQAWGRVEKSIQLALADGITPEQIKAELHLSLLDCQRILIDRTAGVAELADQSARIIKAGDLYDTFTRLVPAGCA